MKTIELLCFAGSGSPEMIVITIEGEGGAISSSLHGDDPVDTLYRAALDGMESMILAHAIAGVDVESPAYVEGIETAVEAAANNI